MPISLLEQIVAVSITLEVSMPHCTLWHAHFKICLIAIERQAKHNDPDLQHDLAFNEGELKVECDY